MWIQFLLEYTANSAGQGRQPGWPHAMQAIASKVSDNSEARPSWPVALRCGNLPGNEQPKPWLAP